MRIALFAFLAFLMTNLAAQDIGLQHDKTYPPDSLKWWTRSVMDGISEKHPGFYRYTGRKEFDHLIDSTVSTIDEPLTQLEYYRKMKPLFAKIGCLHTSISLPTPYQRHLDSTSTLIPIGVFIDSNGKVLLARNYDEHQVIPIGGEVVSINHLPISDILSRLFKAIPSDGYNQSLKTLLLNHQFSFWYQAIIEVPQTFVIELKADGITQTYQLKGVSGNLFPSIESLESNFKKPLEFEIANNTGILKVHSFAKSTVKEHGQNFRKFIKATFQEIQKKKIKNLVVDLRYNTGGTDGHAAYLASYFFDRPFRYWDRIEVTEALAKEIKGVQRLFYKRPKKVGNAYHWKKVWITNEFDYYLTQKPARRNFKGTTYLLTNGLSMSSCSDLVAILSHNKKAIVVGQESGGGFQGNTSGMMPTATIPTGLQIVIPLQKYINAVDLNKNFGRGTPPDYPVSPTFDDWIKQRDIEMEFTFRLINGNQAKATYR